MTWPLPGGWSRFDIGHAILITSPSNDEGIALSLVVTSESITPIGPMVSQTADFDAALQVARRCQAWLRVRDVVATTGRH